MEDGTLIVTASADGQVNIWKRGEDDSSYTLLQEFGDHHQQSVTTLTVARGTNSSIIVSGSSDGQLAFWAVDLSIDDTPVSLVNNLNIGISTLPLTSAISFLPQPDSSTIQQYVVAIGNTSKYTYIYVGGPDEPFLETAKLEGQSDWVRSLAFSPVQPNGSIFLASGCQDRYIRIWNLSQGRYDPLAPVPESMEYDESIGQLSNKVYQLNTAGAPYNMKFDALIIGHDDWIYSLKWHPSSLQLMSSSADSSIMIWTPDEHSGVWLSKTQLGDISIKGASTATGAYGGMWYSSWIGADDQTIISLSNTGAWKCWTQVESHLWKPATGISGHIKNVTDISWSTDGRYLLSTGLDKTTRLYAPWLKDPAAHSKTKWYEMARPQIHGYDMIAVESLSPSLFVSAGDEKVLRTFSVTKSIATLINNTVGFSIDTESLTSGSATVPALGLSNKATTDNDGAENSLIDDIAEEDKGLGIEATENVGIDKDTPPLEDQLQRLTLWPEAEKIYGHGYEVTTIAISHDRSLVVSACKANSVDHAVVRITDTETWQKEFKPLSFHTLTTTSLKFSPNDRYLLSVSRDRSWALWKRNGNSIKETGNSIFDLAETSKLHTRIIWDCCWANVPDNYYFFTASRDKTVKLWTKKKESESADGKHWEDIRTILFKEPVTAIDVKYFPSTGKHVLAAGLDTGAIYLVEVDFKTLDVSVPQKIEDGITPAGRINTLSWNPHPENMSGIDNEKNEERVNLLGIASEDRSVRVLKVE